MNIRNENGVNLPAVNVKPPLLFQRLPKALQEAPDEIRNSAYEQIAESWWEDTMPEIAAEVFASLSVDVHASAAGRSNGWVVVRGLGEPSDWKAVRRSAWARFEKKIAASILQAERDWQRRIREWMSAAKNASEWVATIRFPMAFGCTEAQAAEEVASIMRRAGYDSTTVVACNRAEA